MSEKIMNIKYLEIVTNLIREQNEQLLYIISEKENIPLKPLLKLLPSRYKLNKELMDFVGKN